MASAMISGPIPSPGKIAIVFFIVFSQLSRFNWGSSQQVNRKSRLLFSHGEKIESAGWVFPNQSVA
jgi:hypothetical protein